MTIQDTIRANPRASAAVRWLVLAGIVILAYGRPLVDLARLWLDASDYQHCFLVPVFAAFLLWHRREMLEGAAIEGSLWGVWLLALSVLMRWGSVYLSVGKLDAISLLPCLVQLVRGCRLPKHRAAFGRNPSHPSH